MIGAIAAMLAAAPAFAASTTIQFVRNDGTQFTLVLNDDGTASVNGGPLEAFTWTAETRTLCAASGLCVMFAAVGEEVGFSTSYQTNQGNAGTATITAVQP